MDDEVRDACKAFLKKFGVPAHLREQKLTILGLVVIQAPSSASNLEKFFENNAEIMAVLPQLLAMFSKIFRENSVRLRKQFFKHETLRYLWNVYLQEEGHSIS